MVLTSPLRRNSPAPGFDHGDNIQEYEPPKKSCAARQVQALASDSIRFRN